MLLQPTPVDEPRLLATKQGIRRGRIGHVLFAIATTVSFIIVFWAFSTASTRQGFAQQQIVSDIVRLQEKASNNNDQIHHLELLIAANAAEIKAQGRDVATLTSEIDGMGKLIRYGGSIIGALAGLGTWFSRNPKRSA